MHTILVITGGFMLLGLLLLTGRLAGRDLATCALWFIPAWFAAAAINMWIGVSRAGYSVGEEIPMFLVVFGVPVAIAALLWRRLAGGRSPR